MIAVIQRVKEASVMIDNDRIGRIGNGLLIFLGIEQQDNEEKADKLCERVLNYRLFADKSNKMSCSVKQIDGSVLIVSQFTLTAVTNKGLRPSFSKAATPEKAIALYNRFIENCKKKGVTTQSGKFSANMQVALVNDGPVTFWLTV